MSEYRYWRLTNIITPGKIAASEINFITESGALSNIPTSISQFSDDGVNVASNLLDGSVHTFSISGDYPDNTKSKFWIKYDFRSNVKVTAIKARMKNPSDNTSWVSCEVEASNDDINYEYIGACIFNCKINNTDEITVVIRELPRKDTVSWYNIIPDSSCIFALDYNSTISPNGMEMFSTNNGLKFTAINGGGAAKSILSNFYNRNYVYDYTKFSSYKALFFNNSKWHIEIPVNIYDEFTIILLCQPYKEILALSRRDQPHTFFHCFGIENISKYGYSYLNRWRVNSSNYFLHNSSIYEDSQDRLKFQSNNSLEKCIITCNKSTLKGKFITNYGTYDLNSTIITERDSAFTITDYDLIGWGGNESYNLLGGVVAYGLFAKSFTEEELEVILNKIDEEFLLDKDDSFDIIKNITEVGKYQYFKYVNTDVKNHEYIPIKKPILDLSTFYTASEVKYKTMTKETIVKEYIDIEDYVYEEGTPIITTLTLIDRDTGIPLSRTKSDATGYFSFKNIRKDLNYVVISSHPNHQFNSIIKDY